MIFLVNTLLASLLIEGAMSYLNFAYRLMHFPLGVFAVAVGTVALPKISGEVARNQFDQLVKIFYQSLSLTMFLVIPSAVYLAFFSDDLVSFLEELGVSVELERGGRFFPTDNRAADIRYSYI